jgi:rSAM/selenodomain-associated transferase 2
MDRVRLAVVIPTFNSEKTLAATLNSLQPGRVSGLVREVIVVDGGSTDGTWAVATAFGARPIGAAKGRGSQLAAGARTASTDRNLSVDWLLFLHADTILEGGWDMEVAGFCDMPGNQELVGVFAFALDDTHHAARRLEKLVEWRTRFFGMPYGDQGLVIHRSFYNALGGFRSLPLMEDVDLVRRIGKRRLHMLNTTATTSAARYRSDGYLRRSARNLLCLLLCFLRVPPHLIAKLYR